MNQIINIGVLGCADIAKRLVIPAIKASDKFKLVAIASRSAEKAREFSFCFSCDAIEGYSNLITRKDIHAVYVPLPIGMHHEWVTNSLQNNKHVLCEKSLATDYSSARAMVETARKHSLALEENFAFAFHSQHQVIRDMIVNGELGEIRCFRSSFGFPPFPDQNNIRYSKTLGGGSLLDAGAYTVKATRLILGDAIEVKASHLNVDSARQIDIFGGAFLVTEAGIFSEIAFGFDNYYQCNYEIWGSKGKLISERAFTAGPGIQPRVIVENQGEKHVYTLPSDNHFSKTLDHFHHSIQSNTPETSYSDILNQSRLITQIQEHAAR